LGKSLRVTKSNAVLLAVVALGCRSEAPRAEPLKPAARVIGGDRAVRAFRPANTTKPAPVILVLHGYGGDGPSQFDWFGLSSLSDAHVVAPDGTLDSTGHRFWNAVDTCCDFEARHVDDVKYLLSLIDDIATHHAVDRARVYAVGLSNGGAMALRLACEAADKVAAVVSIAAPWSESARCEPSQPVAIRQLHGTADRIVPFGGGAIVEGIHPNAHGKLPSADALATVLGRANGCGALAEERTLDIDRSVPGAETTVARAQCKPGGETELWTLRGSAHVPPPFAPVFVAETWSFLSAHHR
jgi:polyhydroxybutyrate depolymerase